VSVNATAAPLVLVICRYLVCQNLPIPEKVPANTGNGMMRRDPAQGKKKPAHIGEVAGFDAG
jgi:hypothetical protein